MDIFTSTQLLRCKKHSILKYACSSTSGVDAFDQPWAAQRDSSRRHLAYINGPFDRMGAIVRSSKMRRWIVC